MERRSAARDLALVSGLPQALRQLRAWLRRPLPVIGPWLLASMGIGLLLLVLVGIVAELSSPDPERPRGLPFRPAWAPDRQLWQVVQGNLVVLALHATACLAGYIVHAAMRDPAADPDALERVTRATARVAIWWVPAATVLSIATQAWVLGGYAATVSEHLHMRVWTLLATTIPHALPELTAVFLPLAAWLVAMRRGRMGELYAATMLSVLVALPLIVGAAWLEVHTWHDRVRAAPASTPDLEGVTIGTLAAEGEAGGIELVLGERVSDHVYVDDEQALGSALQASADAHGAVAIVELGLGHQLWGVRRYDTDTPCGGSEGSSRVTYLHDLEAWRFVRRGTSIPGSVTELDVQAIVDAPNVVVPAQWTASAAFRGLVARRCDDQESGDA